jgi:hypothetical protein
VAKQEAAEELRLVLVLPWAVTVEVFSLVPVLLLVDKVAL